MCISTVCPVFICCDGLLGTITLCNDIQLPVEAFQLTQILGFEYPQELILYFADFPFTGNTVEIFNIIQNILTRLDCIWEEFWASMISSRTEDIS